MKNRFFALRKISFNTYALLCFVCGTGAMLHLLSGCDADNLSLFSCETCYTDSVETGTLEIELTVKDTVRGVPITIYRGNLEDSSFVFSDIAYSSTYRVDVSVEREYTAVAEYQTGVKTIYTVDHTKLKLKKNYDSCDEPCYYVSGGKLNLRLKQ